MKKEGVQLLYHIAEQSPLGLEAMEVLFITKYHQTLFASLQACQEWSLFEFERFAQASEVSIDKILEVVLLYY